MYDTIKTLLEVAHNICQGSLKATLPDPLDDNFREMLGEFLAICKPICSLTDHLQGDGITGHRVIPGIAEAHDSNLQLYLQNCVLQILP